MLFSGAIVAPIGMRITWCGRAAQVCASIELNTLNSFIHSFWLFSVCQFQRLGQSQGMRQSLSVSGTPGTQVARYGQTCVACQKEAELALINSGPALAKELVLWPWVTALE